MKESKQERNNLFNSKLFIYLPAVAYVGDEAMFIILLQRVRRYSVKTSYLKPVIFRPIGAYLLGPMHFGK